MFGPTGVGVLYGKEKILNSMTPYQAGGEMIKQVSFTSPTTFNELPFKFEAGTPNIAGVIAFAKAVKLLRPYLESTFNQYSEYEEKLTQYCYQALKSLPQVHFVVKGKPDIAVIAFTVSGHHIQDIASTLDIYGIAVRSGHHCAMPLMESLGIDGCLRVSLAAYNTLSEVDYFIECLSNILAEQDTLSQPAEKIESEPFVQIKEKFSAIHSWDSRHREIMLLGKTLNRLDKNERNDRSLISGCESKAWLLFSKDSVGVYTFQCDSDAKIIRGLLVIVLAAYNNKTAQQVNQFDITDYFSQLGLIQHLSPSRSNGLLAIVDKIKHIVNM
jgi:cysteine desulfurase/selenocysteine lyase